MRHAASFAGALTAAMMAAGAANAQDDGLQISLTPYIWVALPEGDVSIIGNTGNTGSGGGGIDHEPINANFDDIGLSGAFTAEADVRYNRFGVLADLSYFKIKADKDITLGPLPTLSGEVEVTGTKALLAVYWRAYENEKTSVDLLAGGHYLGVDLDVDVVGPNRAVSLGLDNDNIDPMIGIRGRTQLTEHFGLLGMATYGGFDVESKSLYELHGYVTYRFNDTISARLGYRYYSTEWESDRIKYDASFGGPLLGVTFTF